MQTPLIRLFGPLAVEHRGRTLGPADFQGVKPRQLLEILLLAEGHPVPKDRLADLLWDEDPPRNVGATIETYVSVLRRVLGRDDASRLIVTEAEAYRLDRAAAVVDVDRFDDLVTRAGHLEPRRRRPLLEEALGLVRGELLEDEPYASWAEGPRKRYRRRTLEVRLDACTAALAEGDTRAALEHGEALVGDDPLDERAHRAVMVAAYADGTRHSALRAYDRCRSVLAEELGMDPDEETEEVHRAILRDADPADLVARVVGSDVEHPRRGGAGALRGRRMRVLLVEDDPADARLITDALSTSPVPMEVDHVEDGEGVAARAAAPATRPDLVLLDVGLPGRSGLEVLADLKGDERLRRIPVVMLTASAAETDVARSYDLHANSYVTKPVDLDDFAEVVRALEAFWPLTARTPRSDGDG